MAKRIYLVDTENVHSTWKELLPVLSKNDKMLLFYTANSPYISYADLREILSYPDSFEMIECYTGNNGLDFQLVSYMGYLLKTAAKTEYVIVSNDMGYEAAIKFWRDRERVVLRMTTAELLKLNRQPAPVPESATQPAPEQSKSQQSQTAQTRGRRRKRPSKPEEALPVQPAPQPALPAPPAAAPAEAGSPEGKKEPAEHRRKGQTHQPKALPPHKEPESSQPKPAPAPSQESGQSPTVPANEEAPVVEEKLALLRETLSQVSEEDLLWVYHMLGQFSPRKLALIHVQLVKQYGQDDGTEYYKLLKPVLRKFFAKTPQK